MEYYHFHNFDFSINAEGVEECLEILLHLNGVVFHLGHGEDPEFAGLPSPMLFEEKGEQHE